MQIILLEKVKNLGDLGAIVRVKDGYARNFLIPNGLARRATGAALKEFEARRAELEKIAADKLAEAEKVNEKLNGSTLEVRQKAGVDGRLFGSVTNDDIAQALSKLGYSIEKARISLPNGLVKTIGEHPVRVSLHTDVVAEITLVVLGETA